MMKNILCMMIALLFSVGVFLETVPLAYSETTNSDKEVVLEMEEIPGSDSEWFEVFSVGGQEIARRKIAMSFDEEKANPIFEMVEITNNIPDGIVKVFTPDGKLWSERNYKNNKQNGLEKVFNEDGVLIGEAYYSDDTITNNKFFYKNGSVKMEIVGTTQKGYYEDGAVKFVVDMDNHIYTQYDEFGNASPMDEAYMDKIAEGIIDGSMFEME